MMRGYGAHGCRGRHGAPPGGAACGPRCQKSSCGAATASQSMSERSAPPAETIVRSFARKRAHARCEQWPSASRDGASSTTHGALKSRSRPSSPAARSSVPVVGGGAG